MMFLLVVIGCIFLWAGLTRAVPINDQLVPPTRLESHQPGTILHGRSFGALPLPPSEDPFYVPPTRLENYQPGTILRSRSIGALSIAGPVTFQAQAAYQLLYRTTDSLGQNSAAVTTIIVPKNANYSRVLSYQFATDSSWVNCAPSYTIQLGSNVNNWGTNSAETLLVIAALDAGLIVNLPDYEGLQAAFTSGIQAGQATLDSVRAAISSNSITGISPQAEYQMWGYSGGSLASEWAAELQPSYAPELNFKGCALGGLIPNVTSVLYSTNKGPFTGLIPAGILGLANAYPELKAYLDKHLIPSTASKFYKASTQCLGNDITTYMNQDVFSYLDIGNATLLSSVAQQVLSTTTIMGTHGTPKMPIFVYKAVGDEISAVGDTDAVVNKLCSQGAKIEYVRDGNGGHFTQAVTGGGDAFLFLMDRFNGVSVKSVGCTTRNVSSDALDPGALALLGSAISDALSAILQVPAGPSNTLWGWTKRAKSLLPGFQWK